MKIGLLGLSWILFVFSSNVTGSYDICSVGGRAIDLASSSADEYYEIVMNDDCSGAIMLSVENNCIETVGSTVGATLSTGVDSRFYCFGESSPDVWFQFVVPQTGDVVVNTFDTEGLNPMFEIYEGDCEYLALIEEGCGDGFYSVRLSDRTPGERLFVRVASIDNREQGEFGICVFEPEPLVNDICNTAVDLAVGSVCKLSPSVYSDHVANPGYYPTDAFSCGRRIDQVAHPDMWFKFKMPSSGSVRIIVNGIERKPHMSTVELYSGDCSNLSLEKCSTGDIRNPFIIYYGELRMNDYIYIRIGSSDPWLNSSFSLCVISDCPDSQHVSDDLSGTLYYENSGVITANNSIKPSANIVFDAEESVELQSGFEVQDQGAFEAIIDGCDCDIEFEFNSLTGSINDQVCVDLKVSGFDIMSFFYLIIEFDSDQLQFESLNSIVSGLANFTIDNFELPNDFNTNRLSATWEDSSGMGQSISDGSKFMEICFNIIDDTPSQARIGGILLEPINVNNMVLETCFNNSIITIQ